MANWEKKSSYLLREIVKFTTYIDSLHAAEAARERIYAERAAHQAVAERKDEDEEGEGDTTLTGWRKMKDFYDDDYVYTRRTTQPFWYRYRVFPWRMKETMGMEKGISH